LGGERNGQRPGITKGEKKITHNLSQGREGEGGRDGGESWTPRDRRGKREMEGGVIGRKK